MDLKKLLSGEVKIDCKQMKCKFNRISDTEIRCENCYKVVREENLSPTK